MEDHIRFGGLSEDSNNIKIILETIPSAAALVDAEGKVLYVNQRGRELYGIDYSGFKMDEHITKVMVLRPDGSPLPPQEMPLSQSLNSGLAVGNVEMTIRNINGDQIPVNVSSSPLSGPDGRRSGAIVIIENLSERKRAQEALWASEEKYRTLFRNAEYGFVVVEPLFEDGKVNDLRYLEMNPAFERITGLQAADFLGKRLLEALPGIEPQWIDMFDQVTKSGKPVHHEGYNSNTGHWFEAVVFPYANGLLGEQFINITERKQAEQSLRERTRELEESNRQRTDILESISDCFYALDKDLRFTYVNKATEDLWGLSRANLLGRKIEEVFDGLIDISLSKFHQVITEQTSQYYEVFSKVALKWGDMSVCPTPDGISVYFHDITERKQAEEALQERQRLHAFQSAILESVRDPLWVSDPGLRIVYWNDAATAAFGWTAEEVLGRHTGELFKTLVPGSTREVSSRRTCSG